jgi:hypothetical protein
MATGGNLMINKSYYGKEVIDNFNNQFGITSHGLIQSNST